MRRKRTERCYYCGEPASTTEHAPPKMLFKGFDACDSITAPSCTKHNSDKADQAIIYSLLITLDKWKQAGHEIPPDAQHAIQVAMQSFQRSKRKTSVGPLLSDPPASLQGLEVATLAPEAKIGEWMKQLTAVLIWDALKSFDSSIDWKRARAWNPETFPKQNSEPLDIQTAIRLAQSNFAINANLSRLTWLPGWSSHPRSYRKSLFRFSVCFQLKQPDHILFRHIFFDTFTHYVELNASPATRSRLEYKVADHSGRASSEAKPQLAP